MSTEENVTRAPSGLTALARRSSVRITAVNPFENPGFRCTPYNVLKTILLGLTLFPIRLVLLILGIMFALLFALIGAIGYSRAPEMKDDVPLSGCRRVLFLPCRFFARVCLFALGFWWVSVTDDRKGKHAPIIISNHVALADFIYFAYTEQCSFVAKTEVRDNPVLRAIANLCQTIWVDRKDPDSRHKVKDEIIRRAQQQGKPRFLQTMMFPEGTTTNGRALVQFKTGPFNPGVPVSPVTVKYSKRHYDPSSTGAQDGPIAFIWMMLQFYNHMSVHYLPVYEPNDEEKEDPAVFAHNIRQIMADDMGVAVTNHTYEDLFLKSQAERAHVDQTFEMKEVMKRFGVDLAQTKEMMKRFAKIDNKTHDGQIAIEEFCNAAGLERSKYSEALFNLFDRDQSGTIDFIEFLYGLSIFSDDAPEHDRRKLAFRLYDKEAKAAVSRAGVEELLRYAKGLSVGNVDEAKIEMAAGALFQQDGESIGFSEFVGRLDAMEANSDAQAMLVDVPMQLAQKQVGGGMSALKDESRKAVGGTMEV